MPTRTNDTRDARIDLRASSRQAQLIRAAAAATDRTLTDFVLDAVVAQAEKVLADRRYFIVSDEQWAKFEELVAAPPRETPKLDALMSPESPFAPND
jgi:uncharacterized protein (DUF1778 family)